MKSVSLTYLKLGEAPLPPNCTLAVHPFPFSGCTAVRSASRDTPTALALLSQHERVAHHQTAVSNVAPRIPTNEIASPNHSNCNSTSQSPVQDDPQSFTAHGTVLAIKKNWRKTIMVLSHTRAGGSRQQLEMSNVMASH